MFRILVVFALGSSVALGCDGTGSAKNELPTADCRTLLGAIDTLVPKDVDWAYCQNEMHKRTDLPPQAPIRVGNNNPPPPPPPPALMDTAHCALLDPKRTEFDSCLLEVLATDDGRREEPRCPKVAATIANADLAFFVLSDRHPGLWEDVLPTEIVHASQYELADWLETPGRRAQLAERIRQRLVSGREVD